MFTISCEPLPAARLAEPRRFPPVVAGLRQVGKTTLLSQALEPCGDRALYVSADEPRLRDREWIARQWDAARIVARNRNLSGSTAANAVLALDEIHKIPARSEIVKRLWDEDSAAGLSLQVVLLGSGDDAETDEWRIGQPRHRPAEARRRHPVLLLFPWHERPSTTS